MLSNFYDIFHVPKAYIDNNYNKQLSNVFNIKVAKRFLSHQRSRSEKNVI